MKDKTVILIWLLIVVLCILIGSLTSKAQNRMHMDVMIVEDSVTYCYSDTLVVWGNRFDIWCLAFVGKNVCYQEIPAKQLGKKQNSKLSEEIRLYKEHLNSYQIVHYVKLVQDDVGDKYLFSVTIDRDDGMIIYISKLWPTKGVPTYYISLTSHQLCQN